MARMDACEPSLTLKLISWARFWLRFGLVTGGQLGEQAREFAKKVEEMQQVLEMARCQRRPRIGARGGTYDHFGNIEIDFLLVKTV